MGVLYISSMFEDEDLKNVFSNPKKVSYAANKYNKLLSEGFALNDIDVLVLAMLPVTSSNCNKKFIRGRIVNRNKLKINFLSVINLPFIKNIFRAIQVFFKVLTAPKGTTVIYDIFSYSANIGMLPAALLRRFDKICILTDLPEFIGEGGSERKVRFSVKLLRDKADGYILLTEQMTDKVNTENKKYEIVEGIVPYNHEVNEQTDKKTDKKIVLYAGSLHREYGIVELVDSFLKCHKLDEELHLYGSGNYATDIENIARENSCVIFHGVFNNNTIMQREKEATLLVNPRTSEGEFTKYSFPSKVIEYMSSGTPALMAVLPGIPDEYYKFVYTFDDKRKGGLAESLRFVLNKTEDELKNMGKEAQNFVFSEKNNLIQTKKVADKFGL